MTDLVEDRIISEEYKLWKKNTPFMYDYMMTRAVEWPSPTVQWFPDTETITSDETKTTSLLQRLLLGTNSGTDENYLTLVSVLLPIYEDREQNDLYHMRDDEFGAFTTFTDKYTYDLKIPHQGPVQTARYMPDNKNIIATKSDEDLFIFDIEECKQRTYAEDEEVECEPLYEFTGLNSQAELVWNPEKEATLLTGYKKNQLALWDINSQNHGSSRKSAATRKTLKVMTKYSGHSGAVTDVAWHQLHTTIFGSTSSDGELAVWDIRSQETTRPSHKVAAHKFSINSVEFNPFSEYLLATSSMDRSIALWDLRNLKLKLHSIRVRDELLHRIRWSPHFASILGACNNDRRIYLFDMDRIFEEQTPDDVEDGPATLVFSHNGHTSPIYDLAWNPSDELMVCSISEDNVLQFWQVMSKLLSNTK